MLKRMSKRLAVLVGVMALAVSCGAADFSADMITKAGKMTVTGKVYRKGNLIRQDTKSPMGNRIIILRQDKKVMWMLDPATKTYVELPMREKVDFAKLGEDARLKKMAVKKPMGREKVNGVLCDKFQLVYKDKRMGTSTHWVSNDLQWPIKTESKGPNTMLMECKNIKVGAQPMSLFELPKGYKKTKMPSGGPMGMGMPKMPRKPH